MKTSLRTLAFAISIAFNLIFIFLALLVALFAEKVQTSRYFTMSTNTSRYLHSALILSVPADGADVNFGPVEFLLKKGSVAALQLSVIRDSPLDRKPYQSNLALEPLYDPSVISIEPSGYGLFITGRQEGETTVQIFSGGSFRDIARIVVYDPSTLDE
jgi:hypothetical protein